MSKKSFELVLRPIGKLVHTESIALALAVGFEDVSVFALEDLFSVRILLLVNVSFGELLYIVLEAVVVLR